MVNSDFVNPIEKLLDLQWWLKISCWRKLLCVQQFSLKLIKVMILSHQKANQKRQAPHHWSKKDGKTILVQKISLENAA
jgi:hypothetical protein